GRAERRPARNQRGAQEGVRNRDAEQGEEVEGVKPSSPPQPRSFLRGVERKRRGRRHGCGKSRRSGGRGQTLGAEDEAFWAWRRSTSVGVACPYSLRGGFPPCRRVDAFGRRPRAGPIRRSPLSPHAPVSR